MRSDTTTARSAGVLFLVTSAAAIIGGTLLAPAIEADFLTEAATSKGQIVTGVIFELAQAVTGVGIAVVLLPVLRRHREDLAQGYVAARLLEGVFVAVGALSAALLLGLSQQAGADPSAGAVAVGDVLLDLRDWSYWTGPMAFFSVSALILYVTLYRSALVPRWLAVWGFLGGVLLLVSAVLEMFGADLGATQVVFSAPIGLNELVLAVWLIAKGFTPGGAPSTSGASTA